MLKTKRQNIMESGMQTISIPVNTRGVMGKGLALSFANLYPDINNQYKTLCKSGELDIGSLITLPINDDQQVLLFPTKEDWRKRSKYRYIIQGFEDLLKRSEELGITELAIPALGCGLGGLDYHIVKELCREYSELLPYDVTMYISPGGRS